MDATTITQVRRFNRTVAERIGVLSDQFLGLDRPIGEARLLWEIGDAGRDVRWLRSQLGLDSGYVSRLLRALEADGLVTVEAQPHDRRVRTVRLTAAGNAERAELDRRSDELAASLLEPLTGVQRDRLVGAMDQVGRLLTASMVTVEIVNPEHPDAKYCLHEYYAELGRRFDNGFDAARSTLPDPNELRPPGGALLVARLHDKPVGCGGLVFHGEATDIKRMWVAESARGLGLGRRLLHELEREAARRGYAVVRLETNRALTEAIAMYRSSGYVEVDAFNAEPYAHHWFEKRLTNPLP